MEREQCVGRKCVPFCEVLDKIVQQNEKKVKKGEKFVQTFV